MSKPHGKSKEDLARMKMSELLQLVKNHNLAKHIHLYRRMKKAELVESLAKYKSSVPIKASASAMKATPSPPETPIRMKVPPRAPKKPVAAAARDHSVLVRCWCAGFVVEWTGTGAPGERARVR